MQNTLPSNKPRFEGRLEPELAAKADAYRKERNWRRGDLVKYAIARILDENRLEVELDEDLIKALKVYADEGFRSMNDQIRMILVEWFEKQTRKNND